MANELRSQIATRQAVSLNEALLRDATNAPQPTLNPVVNPNMPVCLYLNQSNGIQLPAAIGAAKLEDNTFGMNVRSSVREEGILKVQALSETTIGASPTDITITVPQGKIWVIKRTYMAHVGGTITGNYCQLYPIGSAPTSINIDLYLVGSTNSYKDYPAPITLKAGSYIMARCYHSVAITGQYFSILYQEFDA